MTTRALVATDGDPPARAAITLLERLGDRAELELSVLCVASFDLAVETGVDVGRYSPEGARRLAGDVAGRGAARLRKAGFHAEPEAVEGHPTVEILRRMEDGRFDLVIMGGGKRTWLDRLLLGSVSTAVLQSSPRPVLVTRAVRDEVAQARVLVGADGSGDAARAAETFARLADPARSSVEVLTAGASDEAGHGDRPAELLRAAGWDPQTSVVQGHAAEVFLGRLASSDPDLVVAGARGAGTHRPTALGSVTDKLIREARATLVGR
ncbi:MAG TPA: universal stress protein [Actinomycetota bacterium]